MPSLPDVFKFFLRMRQDCTPVAHPAPITSPDPVSLLAKEILKNEAPEKGIRCFQEPRQGKIWEKIGKLTKGRCEQLNLLFCTAAQKEAGALENRVLPLLEFAAEELSEEATAKLIYLADANLNEACRGILGKNAKEAASWIEGAFAKQLSRRLDDFHRHIKKYRLQNPELARHSQFPLLISSFLLTSTGGFNVAMIKIFERDLISEGSPNSYTKSLIEALRALHLCPILREMILRTEKPENDRSLISTLIRIQLNLPPKALITSFDTKKCLLANFLSNLRQGPAGSCFATFLAILMQRCHPQQCLADLRQLIKTGMLTRAVNGVVKNFPVHLKIRSKEIDQKISLDKKGRFLKDKDYIADVPGIYDACIAMKIENPREAVSKILFEEKNRMTVRELIERLAYSDSKSMRTAQKNFALGCFAFQAKTNPALLRIWENSIAQMAEAHEAAMVKMPILYAIITALKEKGASSGVVNDLREELLKRIHLYYDPDITKSESSDAIGGFVLYDMNHEAKPSKWVRIGLPEKFQAFVRRTLEAVDLFDLLPYAESRAFLQRVLELYSPSNKNALDPVGNWEKLPHIPWRTLSGNVAQNVLEVYLQSNGSLEPCSLKAKNGEELLEILCELSKSYPNCTMPVFTPYHAFIVALDPHIEERAERCRSITEELADSKFLFDKEEAANMIARELIHPEKHPRFFRQVKSLPFSADYRQYRKALVQIADALEGVKEGHRTAIDRIILENLSDEAKSAIINASVIFADTGWQKDLHNIYYCLTLNPLKRTWTLLEVSEDGKLLKAVPKSRFFNIEWKYYPRLDIA